MTTYNVEIVVNGRGNASGFLQSTGGALQRMGEIAGGILAAGVFQRLADGVMNLGREALDSYASYERLGMALQSLSARELLNSGQATNMGEAMAAAKGQAAELQGWIQKLAIQSPFQQEDVASSFRLAMAYGFTTKEAQRLTQATIDFASGSGASSYAMEKIALALGQIRAKGKLAGGEVLQLTEAGLDVRNILSKAFGVTTAKLVEMQEKGLIPADQAIEALVSSLEKDFGGAAKAQSATFSGLISSLKDIKSVGLREFFTGTFQAIQPYLTKFVDTLSKPETMASLREMGNGLGKFVAGGLENLPKIIRPFEMFFNMVRRGVTVVNALGRTFAATMKGLSTGNLSGVAGSFASLGGQIGKAFVGMGGTALAGLATAFSAGKIVALLGPKILLLGGPLGGMFSALGGKMFSAIVVGLGSKAPELGAKFFRMFMTGGSFEKFAAAFGSKFGAVFGVIGKVLGPVAGILGGISPVVLIAVATLTAFGVVMKALQGDGKFFADLWAKVQVALQNFGAAFGNIAPVLQALGQKIFGVLAQAGTQLAEKVLPFLVDKFNQLSVWFVQNSPLINQFVMVLSNIFMGVLVPAIVGAWTVIQPILDGLFNIILGLGKLIMQVVTGDWAGAWTTIQSIVTTAVSAVWTALINLGNWVVSIFMNLYNVLVGHSLIPDLMNAMGSIILAGLEQVKAFFSNGLTYVTGKVSAWAKGVGAYFADAITGMVSAVQGGIATLMAAGQSLIDGLWSGITDRWAQMVADFQELVSLLPDAVKQLLGIASPSKVFMKLGREVPRGFAKGITGEASAVQRAIQMAVYPQRLAPAYAGAGRNTTYNSSQASTNYFGQVVFQTVAPTPERDMLRNMR